MNAKNVQGNDCLSLGKSDRKPVAANEATAIFREKLSRRAKSIIAMRAGVLLAIFSVIAAASAFRYKPESLSTCWGYPVYLLGALGAASE